LNNRLELKINVVRKDLQLKNLLLPAPDAETLSNYEEQQFNAPLPRKVLKDRTIYKSSRFPPSNGLPLLTDFGEARFGVEDHDGDIMPNAYRAPEVIMKGKWDYKVDIWNAAMAVSRSQPAPHLQLFTNGAKRPGTLLALVRCLMAEMQMASLMTESTLLR
jgi:hypothetical protein